MKKQEVSDEVEGRGVTGPNLERWQCKQTCREKSQPFWRDWLTSRLKLAQEFNLQWELLKQFRPQT